MSLEVTKIVIHRYFEAIPTMAGHKGICTVFLNHHLALNNILISRPAREGNETECKPLTIKYPRLTRYKDNPDGGHDKYHRCIVVPDDKELHEHIEGLVVDTFTSGYLDVVPYMKDGIPVPKEVMPKYNCGTTGQFVPEFTDVKFYKYLPARSETPICRYDTYLFSCSLDGGLTLCEMRLVLRPEKPFVAVPTLLRFALADGTVVTKDRAHNLLTPITRKCRDSLERAASDAFKRFSEQGCKLDDGKGLPDEIFVSAKHRRYVGK